MKKKFFTLIVIATSLFGMKAKAQDAPVDPMDTLTRRVSAIQSMLDVMNRIKISGYIQTQFQVSDSAGINTFAGGNFPSGTDKRFQLRRGRVKFQYDAPLNEKGFSPAQYVFQFDVSQAGLTIKDLYAKLTDKWCGWFSLTAGMQNRPFGFEISYSSSLRESPERGRMSQIIFPGERDLGAMLTIQGPKTGNWNWLKLDAGFFNGTGAPGVGVNTSDFDKQKDFIGHLSMSRSAMHEKIKWGLGASIYSGGFRVDAVDTYKMGKDSLNATAFVRDTKKADVAAEIAVRKIAERNYMGVDAQFSIDWFPGITTIRGEFISGDQPSTSSSSASPAATPSSSVTTSTSVTVIDTVTLKATTTTTTTTSTVASDIYTRKFSGAYIYFLQNIANTPWQAIVKYDWYDPNTDIAGDDIGKAAKGSTAKTTNSTDLKYTTLGLGLAYRYNENIKFTGYFDMVTNETSSNLNGWTKDIHDNVFTLRMQVKF